MRKIYLTTCFVTLSWLFAINGVYGDTKAFDAGMQPILEAYLKIHNALSSDRTDGVIRAAARISDEAETLDPSTVTGKHADHYKHVPMKLKTAADQMGSAKDISTMRETLKQLSKPMAMWATMSKPKGIYVVYCSMTPGSWLQRGKAVLNPYQGSKMLHCGEIVGGD